MNQPRFFLNKDHNIFNLKIKSYLVLYFDKYLLDIQQNDNNSLLNRWKSPAERTLYELKNPDPNSGDDLQNMQAFRAIYIKTRDAFKYHFFLLILVIFVNIIFCLHKKRRYIKNTSSFFR